MNNRLLYVIGGLAFVFVLVTHTPAALVLMLVNRSGSGLSLYGVDGSLMDGTAQGFSVSQHVVPEPLHWHLKPLWLLLLQAEEHVVATGPLDFEGSLRKGPLGPLKLVDVQGQGQFKPLLAAAGMGYTPIDGFSHFDFSQVTLKDGFPSDMEGAIHVEKLAWTLAQNPLLLGDFDAITIDGADGMGLTIQSVQGPLDVHGPLHLNPADASYDLSLLIKPVAGADPLLINLLNSLGPADAQGLYHLHQAGQL